MKEDIRHLVRLQSIEFEIRDLERKQREAPVRIEELENAFQERLEEIGGERLRHESLVAERRELCEEREALTKRLETAQQKLMQVSNQREYSAVLNEIDTTKSRFAEIEQAIASRDAEIEELSGPASEADERIGAEQQKVDAEKRTLEGELAAVSSRLQELTAQSQEIKSSTSDEFLLRFSRIFDARDGIAVAAIESGACGACHLRLRPQVISLCRRGEELVFCENCGRILYLDETPSTPAPAEAAPADSQEADAVQHEAEAVQHEADAVQEDSPGSPDAPEATGPHEAETSSGRPAAEA